MRHVLKLAESWYEETAVRDTYAPLRQPLAVDVCVVGGGLAGLVTTYACTKRGLKTVLLEASRIACGASGRNGGFVSNGYALGVNDIIAHVGLDAAKELHALSREGTEFVRDFLEVHGPGLIMGHGWRVVLRHRDNGSLKSYQEKLNQHFGEPMAYASVEETREKLRTTRYFESLSSPSAFHIHPLKYAIRLAAAAREAGAAIHEDTPALSCTKDGAAFAIATAQGKIRAQHVVHCVSALDPHLHLPSARAMLPVATYVCVTEPLRQDQIATSEAISDTRRTGDYYRLIDEGRILWGGRITTRVSEPARLAERMKADMLSVFPGLGDPRMDYAWAGLMGYALHKMPLIGRDAEGQWFATAFGGHGLNTTAMAGLLMARAIAGEDDAYRRFAAFAPRWAFGPLGRLGVQGSYWWMQARDRFDESHQA